MTLSAGQELETGVGEPSWVVSGVNGELSVTAGGDVLFLLNTVMQADKRVTIRSTGYVDDQGNAVGGNVTFIGVPQRLEWEQPAKSCIYRRKTIYICTPTSRLRRY
jgi:hypothetical protein